MRSVARKVGTWWTAYPKRSPTCDCVYSKGWSVRNRVCGGTTLISKIDGEIRRHTTLISNFQKLCATKQNFRSAACGGDGSLDSLGFWLARTRCARGGFEAHAGNRSGDDGTLSP